MDNKGYNSLSNWVNDYLHVFKSTCENSDSNQQFIVKENIKTHTESKEKMERQSIN